MKKRILAVIACGVIVAATTGYGTMESAEAANTSEASDTDNRGREYVNEFEPDTNQMLELYEVEFQIPEDWVELSSSSGAIVYNSDSDGGTLSIAAGPSTQSDMTLEEVQDEIVASAVTDDSFIETGREIVTILDDVPALYFTCTQNISDIPADEYVLAFFTEDNFYMFGYADRQDSRYNHSQEFDEIIDSITWAPNETYYEISYWIPDTWVNALTSEVQLAYTGECGALIINGEEGSYEADMMGIEENQNSFISEYEKQDSYKLSDRQTITVLGDIPALYVMFSYSDSGELMNTCGVVFCTDGWIYQFLYAEYDSYNGSQMDVFDEIINSISWARDDRSNDFFSDSERQDEYKTLYESYQMSELCDYVEEYISDAGEEISPDDSAYTILELVEPLAEYEDTWTVTQDEFDSSYSVTFAGADTISGSDSISLVVKGSNVQVTVGFQKDGWLFFTRFALSIDGESVENHKIKSYDRNDTVIGSGTIEETYVANSLFKDVSGQLKDAETSIIRFENTDSAETYDHTLTDEEMNALYVGYLLRENYVELSNLLYDYQNDITKE